MAGVLSLGSAEHSWAWSVVEAVGPIADRDSRWNGLVVARDTEVPPRPEPLSGLEGPLFMLDRHVDAVRRAHDDPQVLAEATEYVAAQAVRLTAPIPDRVDLTEQPEADFDAGLGRVWAQERMGALWRAGDSAQLTGIEEVPSYPQAGDPATTATRDLIGELVRQQSRGEFAAISDQLVAAPPDRRWETMARMVPGAAQLPPDELWRLAQQTVRRDFATAVEQGNPGAGTPDSAGARAARHLATGIQRATGTPAGVDPRLAAIAHDPALSPAHRATTAKADGRGGRQTGSPAKGHISPQTPHLGG